MARIANLLSWNRKYSIYKIINFVAPIVIDIKTFQFPKNVVFFNYKVSDVKLPYIKNTEPLITNFKDKIYIKTILNYNLEVPLGTNIKKRTDTDLSVIEDYTRADKKIKFIKPNVHDFILRPDDLLIYNYGALNGHYKYGLNPLNNYYKWYNVLSTVIKDMKELLTNSTKDIFLNLDLPPSLPSRLELQKYDSIPMNRMGLEIFTDYTFLNVLEIWKLLDPNLNSTSLFSSITPEEALRINLFLNIGNRTVTINFRLLLSLIKELELYHSKGISTYSYDKVQKLYYIMLDKILLSRPLDMELVDNSKTDSNTTIIIKGIVDDVGENNLLDDNREEDSDQYQIIVDKMLEEHSTADNGDKVTIDLDEQLSSIEVKDAISKDNEEFETIEEVFNRKYSFENKIKKQLETLNQNGLLSKANKEKHLETLDRVSKLKDPFGSDLTISEMLDDSKDDYTIDNDIITDNIVVFDKEYNKNTVKNLRKSYLEKTFKKDVLRCLFAIQNNGCIIEDINVTKTETILGANEQLEIKVIALNGKSSVLKPIIPTVKPDGTIRMSGNDYNIRPQRADLPLRKIDFNTSELISFYGKFFITKATYSKNDLGVYVKKKLIEKYVNEDNFNNLVTIGCLAKDSNVPTEYSLIARNVKSFKIDNTQYFFSYEDRKSLLKDNKDILKIADLTEETTDYDSVLNKLEDNGKYILIGINNKEALLMKNADLKSNVVYSYNKGINSLNKTLMQILDINLLEANTEYCNIRIYNNQYPVILLLSYYFGLKQLLKMLKIDYEQIDGNPKMKIPDTHYKIKFRDCSYVIKKTNDYRDLIFYGLTELRDSFVKFKADTMDSKSKFDLVFSNLGLPINHVSEIKLVENMFVDPITKTLLDILKLPVVFSGLLLKAVEILGDDNYKDPNTITDMSIKGYERIAGMIYNDLVTSLKDHDNRSYFAKSRINLNPYGLTAKINEDSTTVLIDDLNPIASIKQNEDLNYLGFGGRSKVGMNRDTRSMHPSEIGIVSEASKDSGDVGISAYLTASPNINSTRGIIKETNVSKETSWSNLVSTSAMLAPFSVNEDTKRLNFINIMNSHTISMNEMRVPNVRTGYDSIIAMKSSDKFAVCALGDGEVVNVSKNFIEVKYKNENGNYDGVKVTRYKLYEWTSKEESGSCYTHNVITSLKKGDTFGKDDTITYDEKFFEPDIFNKKRVVYKAGTMVKVALTEDKEVWEDSAAISSRMSSVLGTVGTKVKSVIVTNEDNIVNIKKVGDKLEPEDKLFSIIDGIVDSVGLKLDAKTLETIQGIKNSSPTAKVRGVISKIIVYYNCDIEEMSDTLKLIVMESDKFLLETTGFNGRVNSSYSIKGIPLLDKQLEIKMYIKVDDSMAVGDKAIIANQLKFTVGEVYDYILRTESGIDIDILFSYKSLAARIVNSPFLIGTTSMILDIIKNKAVDMYFNTSE